MPTIIIQGKHRPPDEVDLYPLQVATDGYLIADIDYGQPLAMATDGYVADE